MYHIIPNKGTTLNKGSPHSLVKSKSTQNDKNLHNRLNLSFNPQLLYLDLSERWRPYKC